MTTQEKQDLLDLVKEIIKLSYGERRGDQHVRTDETWSDFRWTAAYDEFMFSLFTDEPRALSFISNVLPADLREQAAELRKKQIQSGEVASGVEPFIEQQDDRPAWVREDREPTQKELMSMSREEMLEAMRRKYPE